MSLLILPARKPGNRVPQRLDHYNGLTSLEGITHHSLSHFAGSRTGEVASLAEIKEKLRRCVAAHKCQRTLPAHREGESNTGSGKTVRAIPNPPKRSPRPPERNSPVQTTSVSGCLPTVSAAPVTIASVVCICVRMPGNRLVAIPVLQRGNSLETSGLV